MAPRAGALMARVSIEPASLRFAHDWARLRFALWPEGSLASHRREIAAYFAGGSNDPHAALLAIEAPARVLGFVELTLRSHAEGCAPGRIGYLEGWYVEPPARRAGLGRALVGAAERWAQDQGCSEFASDAWSTDRASRHAHLALGFEEVGAIRCFRRRLRGARRSAR